jgi:hypothetical protein
MWSCVASFVSHAADAELAATAVTQSDCGLKEGELSKIELQSKR